MTLQNPIYDQFFTLLRAGLWDNHTPDIELFDNQTQWKAIFNLAKEQTVLAIIWDGIEKLPFELYPPRTLKMQWYSYVTKIEQSNQLINQTVVKIIKLYQQNGIHPILIKGAGVATHYRNPLHRGCGDIDIYIGHNDYDKANKIAIEAGCTSFIENADHHSHLMMDDITIENHRIMAVLFNNQANKKFTNKLNQWYPNDVQYVTINSEKIPVAPLEFDTQFVFLHMYKHFITFGIGLRQLCDWAVMLDKANFKNLDLIGHRKGWEILGLTLVKYLGLDADKLPYYNATLNKKATIAMNRILHEGNFGLNTDAFTKRPNNYWLGKLFSIREQIQRWYKLMKLIPKDIAIYVLLHKINLTIKQFLNDNTSSKK